MRVFLKLKLIILLLCIMIDNLISDPRKKKINLGCILKFMNFLNFRKSLEFFKIYLKVFFILKRIKIRIKFFLIAR